MAIRERFEMISSRGQLREDGFHMLEIVVNVSKESLDRIFLRRRGHLICPKELRDGRDMLSRAQNLAFCAEELSHKVLKRVAVGLNWDLKVRKRATVQTPQQMVGGWR